PSGGDRQRARAAPRCGAGHARPDRRSRRPDRARPGAGHDPGRARRLARRGRLPADPCRARSRALHRAAGRAQGLRQDRLHIPDPGRADRRRAVVRGAQDSPRRADSRLRTSRSDADSAAESRMLILIGYAIVVGSIFGGYALAGGHLGAMYQPLELLMIGGGAFGAFVVGNPLKTLKATAKALPSVLKGSKYTKALYMEL